MAAEGDGDGHEQSTSRGGFDDYDFSEESSFRSLYYLFDVDDSKALLFANVMNSLDEYEENGSTTRRKAGTGTWRLRFVFMRHSYSFRVGIRGF